MTHRAMRTLCLCRLAPALRGTGAHSSARLERFPDKEEAGGSSPPGPT